MPRGIDSRTCLSIKSNLAISRKKLASRKHVRIATVRWGRTGYPPTYPRASPEPKASEFARDHPTVLFGFVLYYCLLFIVYCLLFIVIICLLICCCWPSHQMFRFREVPVSSKLVGVGDSLRGPRPIQYTRPELDDASHIIS